jgi:hypothetical protein
MFHVEHPTFSTMTFFLVFSPVFQAAQERSPIAGFFLVGNCGKKRSVETAMGRREEGAGACLLAWKKETGLLCTGTGEYAYLITRK